MHFRLLQLHRAGASVRDIEEDNTDAPYILEGEEFDYDWRAVYVPLHVLAQAVDVEHFGEGLEGTPERWSTIEAWYASYESPQAALEDSPPLVVTTPEGTKVLDGWHRLAVAQDQGAETVPIHLATADEPPS